MKRVSRSPSTPLAALAVPCDMSKAGKGEWRWRLWAANHKDIIADSGEGYVNKADCERGIALCKASYNAEVQVKG